MPGAETHRHITAAALKAAKITAPLLEREYCTYPDESTRPETKTYILVRRGVAFHYLPGTSYDELYRYWGLSGDGRMRLLRPFVNENHVFACGGFRYYFRTIRKALREGKRTEAEKFLGVLMHFLEDAVFALHAFEGPGGVDIYALDRLSGAPVLRSLRFLGSDGLTAAEYTPRLLGRTPELAAMHLYDRYVKLTRDSRRAMFQMALPLFTPAQVDTEALRQRMFDNAVALSADAAYTAFQLAGKGPLPPTERLLLGELEPVRFPLGGGGSRWALRGAEFGPRCIRFGVNFEQHLHYSIAPGYRALAGKIVLTDANPDVRVHMRFLRNGRTVQEAELRPGAPALKVFVPYPCGVCGVSLETDTPSSTLELHDFVLEPCPQKRTGKKIDDTSEKGVWTMASFDSEFQRREFTGADGVRDWYMVRKGDPAKPCIVALHGHGSFGDQLIRRPDVMEIKTAFLVENDFSVISPNYRGNSWMCEAAQSDLVQILAAEKKNMPWKKLFITAGSMGGTSAMIFAMRHRELVDGISVQGGAVDPESYMAWLATQERPILQEILAALRTAFPTPELCRRNSSLANYEKFRGLPFHFAHGGADETIPVSQPRSMQEKLAGEKSFCYREIPGGNHDSPLKLYREQLLWLLEQTGCPLR